MPRAVDSIPSTAEPERRGRNSDVALGKFPELHAVNLMCREGTRATTGFARGQVTTSQRNSCACSHGSGPWRETSVASSFPDAQRHKSPMPVLLGLGDTCPYPWMGPGTFAL